MNKRILLIRLSAMGDVIFNIPLANILKNNGYEVTWLVSEKGYGVVKDNPAVDEAILAPVEKWKKQNFFKNLKEYLQIIRYLRSKHFDIAIDTQLLLKSFIWTVLCGAKRRIVSKSARECAIFGGNEVIGKLANDYTTHAAVSYLKFAEHLNLDTKEIKTSLPPASKEIQEKINDLIKDLDKSKPIITLAPATTWVTKHWNKDNWKELVKKLENNYNLIFTGTSKDIELINYISDGNHLNLAGKTNLLELVELFRHTDLLISLDSGSTHLAWASGHPKIISIFCSTPPTRYAPIGTSDKYIALSGNLACQHCHKRKCPLKTNECTKYPLVEEVLSAVKELIYKK